MEEIRKTNAELTTAIAEMESHVDSVQGYVYEYEDLEITPVSFTYNEQEYICEKVCVGQDPLAQKLIELSSKEQSLQDCLLALKGKEGGSL